MTLDSSPRLPRIRRLAVLPVRLYRLLLAPLLPSCCRFYPTCSEYALEAVMTHGALRGWLLALYRLLRCSPASRGGFDPVPPPRRKSNPQPAAALRGSIVSGRHFRNRFRDTYGQ